MQKPTHVALLVGSPRSAGSSSNSLGTYLTDKLNEKGIPSEKVYVCQAQSSKENRIRLLELVDKSDLIIMAFPLYVDSLHSQVIKTLELIAQHEGSKKTKSKKCFVAIANSGFPEATQSAIALQVCHIFANQVGYQWSGGLAMGGGGMIDGKPLAELGGRVRNQIKALNLTADALAKGEVIPEEAVKLMSNLGTPKWLYLWMGNRSWKQQARALHIKKKELYSQPYKPNTISNS